MKQKTYSDIKPERKFTIGKVENGKCTVLFFDNIQEEVIENEKNTEKKVYSYDMYTIEINYRENLVKKIEDDIDNWIKLVKENDYNETATEIRKQRDNLLTVTDWTQMKDTALSAEEQEKYKKYRQALRDIPEQSNFPYDIEWPIKEA